MDPKRTTYNFSLPPYFDAHCEGEEDKLKFSQFIWTLSGCIASSENRYLQCAVTDINTELIKKHQKPLSYTHSGSFAEGLPNYNDVDMMSAVYDIQITDKEDLVRDAFRDKVAESLYLVRSSLHPGFVNLYINSGQELKKVPHQDLYKKWESYFHPVIPKHELKDLASHGPAKMWDHGGTSADYVMCYKASFWPEMAKEFLTRPRFYGWPNETHLTDIKNLGFHLVAIKHPFTISDDEFRLSFSKAEKYLIRTLTDVQFQCYYLCKEIQRAPCFQDSEGNALVSSYFFKTVLFWLCESKPWKYWMQTTIVDILLDILDYIHNYIDKKVFPNYFIPENDMIIHFPDEKCQATKSALMEMKTGINHILLHSDLSGYIKLIFDHEESPTTTPISTINKLLDKTVDLKTVLKNEVRKFSLGIASVQFDGALPFIPYPEFHRAVMDKIPLIVDNKTPKYITTALQQLLKRSIALNLTPLIQNTKSKHIYDQGVALLSDVKLPGQLFESGASEMGPLLLFAYLNNDTQKVKELIKTAAIRIKPLSLLHLPLNIGLSKANNELLTLIYNKQPWITDLQCDENFVELQNISWETSYNTVATMDPMVLYCYLASITSQRSLAMTEDELTWYLRDAYTFNVGGSLALDTACLHHVTTSFKHLWKHIQFLAFIDKPIRKFKKLSISN